MTMNPCMPDPPPPPAAALQRRRKRRRSRNALQWLADGWHCWPVVGHVLVGLLVFVGLWLAGLVGAITAGVAGLVGAIWAGRTGRPDIPCRPARPKTGYRRHW